MKNILVYICLFACIASCKKEYNPPEITAANNYLVVDGFINIAPNGITTYVLNRAKNLGDTTINIPELNAQVFIKSNSGSVYSLIDIDNTGTYNSTALQLNNTNLYQLIITTSDGHQYQSEFVTSKKSPAIDSITWKQTEDEDVSIFAHTHDNDNKTKFYKWNFIETWEYHARLLNYWGEKNGRIFVLDSTTQMNKCWSHATSTSVITGTTIALNQDVISYAPITKITKDDEKIKVRYSILVQQIALQEAAYNYWKIIEKNSQKLGTLFDLQPAQLKGNIQCINFNSEPVIGFISASEITEKRIFISNTELNNWSTIVTGRECTTLVLPTNPLDEYAYNYFDTDFAPYYFSGSAPAVLIITRKECIDCRLKGGNTNKPLFW